jgi:hypothetical protein
METVETADRIVTVRVRIQRIAPDGYFPYDTNSMHGEGAWMLIIGEKEGVHLALCEECRREFETAIVSQEGE